MAIIFVLLIPVALRGQQDEPSEFDKCRLVTASDLSDPKAPTFEAFPAKTPQTIPNTKLDLMSSRIARKYRTVLRLEIAKGPNYAGYYRVALWGCGSSCAMFAVVNLKTGRVITPERFSTVSGVHFAADEFLSNTKSGGWGFRHKTGSKLLVVVGALDEDDSREGAFYFSLVNEKLHPIHSTVVKKNCENLQP
jgi:hypothetical protein